MVTEPVWEAIDHRDFADGVLYVPAMIEVKPKLRLWGHPDQPRLRERIHEDRPHGIKGQKLLCLLCMRVRAERQLPTQPVWMTFVEGQHGPMFRHEDGRSPHAEHQPETDAHKALKEREARTFQAAGATRVDIEVWRPRARRRPDVVATGPDLTVAGEIQHSSESPRIIQSRQRALRRAGDRVLWTTDRNAGDIGFLHAVPHLAVPALDDHRSYLRGETLDITAGVTMFEQQRCGWADMWTGTQRCPATGRPIPCGRTHLYPTLNASAYRYKAEPDTRFPAGERPHLDYLLEGILNGHWLPYQHRDRVTWIPAAAYDEVAAERGGSVERAESAVVRRRDRAAERACERRHPSATPAVTSHGWWLVRGAPFHVGCTHCLSAPGGPRSSNTARPGALKRPHGETS